MSEWTKYSYVCPDCDALIEITTMQNIENFYPWCSCGSANSNRVQVEEVNV